MRHTQQFLTEANLDVERDKKAFLIPRLHHTKGGHRASKSKGISYTSMRELFNKNLEEVDENFKAYGLHSLRSGGASSAAEHGISDRLISKQGRWASEKSRNRYIKDTKRNRMSVSLNLGV